MLLHYHLLNMCLAELAKLRHHGLHKIRLEIVIIQLKRLLLDEDVAASLISNAESEDWFLALYGAFSRLGKAPELGQAIDDLIESVARLRSLVERQPGIAAGADSGSLLGKDPG
ncbi:hypothetical protein GMLC_26260 [Geomonas limicola]|uniref:Uncharacterized protein n=1 Tax=Geomonas limicola TaxID=2740186 RepID=A0A6V8NB65_9BACT|nr:hypothetical protein [Geomonas limicola]GFO69047.1 hypothetical protein GMLC_26260 [Geomonas limicola]